MAENENVGWHHQLALRWHHQLDGRVFEQALGLADRQGSLAFCSPWGRKESDMTEQLNDNNKPEPK